jgi:hypothetical protein
MSCSLVFQWADINVFISNRTITSKIDLAIVYETINNLLIGLLIPLPLYPPPNIHRIVSNEYLT